MGMCRPRAQVDRLFDWQAVKDAPIRDSMAQQKEHVLVEFRQRFEQARLNLNEQVRLCGVSRML